MPSRTDFNTRSAYLPQIPGYGLLPFRFARMNHNRVLVTNDVGDHALLSERDFNSYVEKKLAPTSDIYMDLRAKNFIIDGYSSVHARILASRYRTKKSFLEGFTKLHIFVVSLRCDHSCPYCQVSRQSEDRHKYDMTLEIAQRGLDLMLKTPARGVTCEFQGGEALLNFPLLKEMVAYVNEKNATIGKDISFVICTNLSTLTDEHLEFFAAHKIKVSTSLDGPAVLHDKNRPFSKGSSHAVTVRNIVRAQEALGVENVSALMTTTKESLKYPKEILDEYLKLNFGSIFVRNLSPYGFAIKTAKAIGYSDSDFILFYKQLLGHVIEANKRGANFSEAFATIVLQKTFTPFPIGYVDLQSPAGAGFGVVVYNYDGEVFASDESRMLAEMDDKKFRLGNVLENSYEEIFFGEVLQTIAAAACNESLAGCSDCGFQPICGADPVYHYATQGDMFGNRAASGFCRKNMELIRYLIELYYDGDDELRKILSAWIRHASLAEMDSVPL